MTKYVWSERAQRLVPAEKGKKKLSAGLLAGAVVFCLALWAVVGWIVMSALNGIHHDWSIIPALGYAASLQVVILTYVLGGVSRLARS